MASPGVIAINVNYGGSLHYFRQDGVRFGAERGDIGKFVPVSFRVRHHDSVRTERRHVVAHIPYNKSTGSTIRTDLPGDGSVQFKDGVNFLHAGCEVAPVDLLGNDGS